MAATDLHHTIETVYRIERTRLIAGLARMVRDIDRAEELAQDSLVTALAEWPKTGIPQNPGAWLMAIAKRRAIDGFRHARMLERKHAELERDLADGRVISFDAIEAAMDDELGDEILGLIFTACHPLLSPDARAALSLRLIGGLTTDEIARAFLSSERTIAQRIVRAKKILAQAKLPFEVPRGAERAARLSSVLEVIYLIFNEGYAATSGDDLIRPTLCDEAQRLGRILAGLMPEEPEVLGLLALMQLQASRRKARTGPDGAALSLGEQNRTMWDRWLINQGLAVLERARKLAGETGTYVLQASLAACHAQAHTFAETDWVTIAGLYDRLYELTPGPIIDLNRAIAHGMAFGPESGLAMIERLERSGDLAGYAPLAAAKGDCLFRAGQLGQAKFQFELAAQQSPNSRERHFLLARAAACTEAS